VTEDKEADWVKIASKSSKDEEMTPGVVIDDPSIVKAMIEKKQEEKDQDPVEEQKNPDHEEKEKTEHQDEEEEQQQENAPAPSQEEHEQAEKDEVEDLPSPSQQRMPLLPPPPPDGNSPIRVQLRAEDTVEVTDADGERVRIDCQAAILIGIECQQQQQHQEQQPQKQLRKTIPSASELQCGKLGGKGVQEAFGSAADSLLPDLVASWVTGHATKAEASEYVGGGTVTSTVLHCWMAAVVRVKKVAGKEETEEVLCTGVLAAPDVVVTSAECTMKVVLAGAQNVRVILGDSNLKVDLPFGVQIYKPKEVHIHEDYHTEEEDNNARANDIGNEVIKNR